MEKVKVFTVKDGKLEPTFLIACECCGKIITPEQKYCSFCGSSTNLHKEDLFCYNN